MNLRKSLAALGVAALVIGACQAGAPAGSGGTTAGGRGPDGALVKRSDIKIEIVTHGQAQDGFWGVVRNGVKAGAADMGVTANYSAPGTESDMPGMAALIDAAINKKPSGLVVSIPNPDALSGPIKKAVAAGIPVVSMNSGSDVFKSLGVLAHVGQTEFEAGQGAGERFKAAGVKNAVCFNQEVGNKALTDRCNGFFTGLTGKTDRREAAERPDHRRRSDPWSDRRQPRARRRRGSRTAHSPCHVRPERRRPDGDQGRQDGLRDRSAAVPPGLPADRDPYELRGDTEPSHGQRERPDHDRPGLRDEGERCGRHRARGEGSALS
jgi:Periplasmic binding protein domain